ncbi:MAG: hypothetical protein AAF813_05965 [Pseudomonadota bacterium]
MTAAGLITLAEYWLWAGAAVAAVFLTIGIDRIDEDARGTYIFRPLLVPGVLLLWPVVLWRWAVLEAGNDSWRDRHLPERKLHAGLWIVLAILIPLIAFGGLALRQTWPAEVAPVLLEPAG